MGMRCPNHPPGKHFLSVVVSCVSRPLWQAAREAAKTKTSRNAVHFFSKSLRPSYVSAQQRFSRFLSEADRKAAVAGHSQSPVWPPYPQNRSPVTPCSRNRRMAFSITLSTLVLVGEHLSKYLPWATFFAPSGRRCKSGSRSGRIPPHGRTFPNASAAVGCRRLRQSPLCRPELRRLNGPDVFHLTDFAPAALLQIHQGPIAITPKSFRSGLTHSC